MISSAYTSVNRHCGYPSVCGAERFLLALSIRAFNAPYASPRIVKCRLPKNVTYTMMLSVVIIKQNGMIADAPVRKRILFTSDEQYFALPIA